jgi:glycosyltransferase involved in cell wall biosynthesis
MIDRLPSTRNTPRLDPSPGSTARPLNVLLLNYEYAPMGGGAGNATHQTARHLVEQGHCVHVLTSALPGQSAVETIDGVVVWRVPSFRTSMLECGLAGAASYLLFAFFRLMRLARSYDYDLYQFYFSLPTGLLALYVRWVLGKPYVIALRGSDVPGYDDSGWFMAPLHRLLRPLTRYLWRHASALTVLSKGLMKLARETVPDVEFKLIPNGVDEKQFPRKTAWKNEPKVRLITVCRMVGRKGLQHLIEAMRELQHSGVELWLVGSGQEQANIVRLVQRHELENCIWMPGYVRRERLYNFYQQADIFVLPSLSESFGQVLLEAMSTGLPVVATTVGGIPEIIHHKRGGLLIPRADPGAIVEAVRSLIAFPERLGKMGRYNATYARERYNWTSVATEYETLYRRVLGQDVPRPIDETGRMRRLESS